MSKSWCTCGDELSSCDEESEFDARRAFQIIFGKTGQKRDFMYWCFSCDKFFELKEVSQNVQDANNKGDLE